MYSSDPAHLTPQRTSVFPSNLNAAIGRARLPPPQMLEGGIEDRENQSELFHQQAQAVSTFSFYLCLWFLSFFRYMTYLAYDVEIRCHINLDFYHVPPFFYLSKVKMNGMMFIFNIYLKLYKSPLDSKRIKSDNPKRNQP